MKYFTHTVSHATPRRLGLNAQRAVFARGHWQTDLHRDHLALLEHCMAEQLTDMAEQLTSMAEQLTDMAEQLTGMAEQLTGMAEQLTGMAEQFTGMAEQLTSMAEQLTCMLWESLSSNGWQCARTVIPITRTISIMVTWRYASSDVANTCDAASASVCNNTMLSQNQKRFLHIGSIVSPLLIIITVFSFTTFIFLSLSFM